MARGLRGSWKQSIFYNTDFKIDKDTLLFLIHELYKIGFTVVVAVSDLGPENQTLWRSIGISPQTLYFKHPSDEEKIVCVFADVPHLLKLLRNHFVDNGVVLKEKILKMNMVEELMLLSKSDLNITKILSLDMLNVKGACMRIKDFSGFKTTLFHKNFKVKLPHNGKFKCFEYYTVGPFA